MSKVAGILLSAVMLFQGFSQLWISLAFYANREFIASELCENRDVPDSGCNGSCQLKKQIGKDKDQKEKANFDIHTKEILVYHIMDFGGYTFSHTFFWIEKIFSKEQTTSRLPEGFSKRIFHPPSLLA